MPPSTPTDGGPSVSVVMATYDGERYLAEMLDSLARQTRLPDELVVRDDGSSDATPALLEAFRGRAPFPVRIERGERLGYAQNFVTATALCSGDVVCFADQDDRWRPGKLAAIAARFEPGRSLAWFHDLALMLGDGTQTSPSYFALLAARGFGPEVSIKGCSMAVSRAFIDLWGWPSAQSRVSHDFWVALLASAYGQRQYVEEVLVDHRLHDANASGWVPSAASRVFTHSFDDVSDVDVMIDLVIRRRNLRRWTRAFLEVVAEKGGGQDPAASLRLRRALKHHRRRYLEASP